MNFGYPVIQQITSDLHGFYRIDHEAYHQGLGISSTKVKKALTSYKQFYHEENYDSAALAFGRAFHAYLLEPELFAAKWGVVPEIAGNKNSNAYKEEYARKVSELQGRELISAEDFRSIKQMAAVARAHPDFPKDFDAEIMAVATCPETGLLLKCKSDMFKSAIVDFKTTSVGLKPAEFLNDMTKWGYHVSAAFYQDVIALVIGERLPFDVVPVLKPDAQGKRAIDCEIYRLSDDLLDQGRQLYKAGLRQILKWQNNQPETKRKRVLYPNARMVYSTKDILEFIEAPA